MHLVRDLWHEGTRACFGLGWHENLIRFVSCALNTSVFDTVLPLTQLQTLGCFGFSFPFFFLFFCDEGWLCYQVQPFSPVCFASWRRGIQVGRSQISVKGKWHTVENTCVWGCWYIDRQKTGGATDGTVQKCDKQAIQENDCKQWHISVWYDRNISSSVCIESWWAASAIGCVTFRHGRALYIFFSSGYIYIISLGWWLGGTM